MSSTIANRPLTERSCHTRHKAEEQDNNMWPIEDNKMPLLQSALNLGGKYYFAEVVHGQTET